MSICEHSPCPSCGTPSDPLQYRGKAAETATATGKMNATAALNAIESLIRRLSSVTERLEILKEQDKDLRQKLFTALEGQESGKVETVYGRVNLTQEKVYDYSEFPDVIAAEQALEEAKARLDAAKAVAKPVAPFTIKRKLVFNRNKAVSARAKSGRIYVRSFLRRRPARSPRPVS